MSDVSWKALAGAAREFCERVEASDPPDLLAVAKAFARLAEAYAQAVVASGATSMRLRAVCKALDLKTSKATLSQFLDEKGR